MDLNVIKEIYRRKSENRERLRQNLLKVVFLALQRLSSEVSFEKAYIFGSLTKPYQFTESSDVDIAFFGLDKDELFFVTSFLNRELGRDVNVLCIENVLFKDKILKEGIEWKRD